MIYRWIDYVFFNFYEDNTSRSLFPDVKIERSEIYKNLSNCIIIARDEYRKQYSIKKIDKDFKFTAIFIANPENVT